MIHKKLLDNLINSLDTITDAEQHVNGNEARGVFYAMMITPAVSANAADWIAALFYGEQPQLTPEQIEQLNKHTRLVYEAYWDIFKANKLKFPFDLSQLNEELAESAYDWCRGFFVGLLVTEPLWFGADDEPQVASNAELTAVRDAAKLFAGLINKDFSRFAPEKIEELHALLQESGQEVSDDLMAALLFVSVPAAVQTLQQFGIRLMQAAISEKRQNNVQPPRKMQRNEPCFCGSGIKYKKCCAA